MNSRQDGVRRSFCGSTAGMLQGAYRERNDLIWQHQQGKGRIIREISPVAVAPDQQIDDDRTESPVSRRSREIANLSCLNSRIPGSWLVATRELGECARRTGPSTRNPACCAGNVIDE